MVQKYSRKIDNIIEAISLAPTSSGLQPFGHCNYKSSERKIRPISWNQSVTDCSHFICAAWDTYTADHVNKLKRR
jgi:nitroreductase